MKFYFTILFNSLCFLLSARQGDVVFKVKANHSISISPKIDTLFSERKYFFKVNGVAMKDIAQMQFTKGVVLITDTGIYVETPKTVEKKKRYSLQFFSNKDGSMNEIFSKDFLIIRLTDVPEFKPPINQRNGPVSFFLWEWPLKNQDTVGKSQMRTINVQHRLSAYDSGSGSINYKIASFVLDVTTNGKTEHFSSGSYTLTGEMMAALSVLKAGDSFTVKEIHYNPLTASPDERIAGPFLIFIK